MASNYKNRNAKVAPEEFTFGIEIECALPMDAIREHGLRPGGYHSGATQTAFERAGLSGWNIQRDSSLRFNQRNMYAIEVTSPVMRGADGVEQTLKMTALLKSWGAKVNASCGLHVTVGHAKFNHHSTLCQLILSMYRFSDAMVAVGASFGRRTRTYSTSLVHKYGVNVDRKTDGDVQFVSRFSRERYQSLNLCNAMHGKRVEFRLFAGTLNTNRMLAAIWSSLGMCQYAMSSYKFIRATREGANFGNEKYYQNNVELMLTWLGWKSDKKGDYTWTNRLGVMHSASLEENAFNKVVSQIRKDAKRMDEANANANYTQRVPKKVRRSRNQNQEAPSVNSDGE